MFFVVQKKKAAIKFKDRFLCWQDGYDPVAYPSEPAVNWADLASLGKKHDQDEDSEVGDSEEEDLQDAESHVPLSAAVVNALGDGEGPLMVTSTLVTYKGVKESCEKS